MANTGDFIPAFQFIASEVNKLTSIRDYIDNETAIKVLYRMYFNVYDVFLVIAEQEENKGYADTLLLPFHAKYKTIKYAYLIEFKYIKREIQDKKLASLKRKLIKEAQAKLQQYEQDETLLKTIGAPPYGMVTLKKIVIVFHGWEMIYIK